MLAIVRELELSAGNGNLILGRFAHPIEPDMLLAETGYLASLLAEASDIVGDLVDASGCTKAQEAAAKIERNTLALRQLQAAYIESLPSPSAELH